MKKALALMSALVALAVSPAMAMNVDDILELCRAGFEPGRIARIVEAAGMEQPLEASDWSRIKTEGCGDEVVDALLNVLAPMEEVEGDEAYDDENVNVNLYGNWGTNGWYGSMFWGGYSPSWGFGYSSFDPWYDWTWRWHRTGSLWYDPWWSYPYGRSYYCHTWSNPYYYYGGDYTGGYYGGGVYHRQKALRQGGSTKAYRYASAKASPVMTKATYASAKAKPYRGAAVATGMNENGAVAVKKSSRASVTTARGTTYTRTKSTTAARGSSGVTTGSVKQKGSSTTARTNTDHSKRKTAVRNGGATSTGNSTTVNRSRTKTRTSSGTSGTSTTVKRKSSGATSTGKAPATTAPSKSSGSSYRAPSSTGAPRGSAPRSGSSGNSGTARRKGTQ